MVRLAAEGLGNKQIAYELKVTDNTIKVHRANAMRKLGASTRAEFVRICQAVKEYERLPQPEER